MQLDGCHRRDLRLRYRLLLSLPLARLILVLRGVYLQNTAREIEVDTTGGYANSLSIHLDTASGGGTLLQRQAQGLGISTGTRKGESGILGDKGGR